MKKIIIKYRPFRAKKDCIHNLYELNLEGKAEMLCASGSVEGEVNGGTLKVAWAPKTSFDALGKPAETYIKFWVFYKKNGRKWDGECDYPIFALTDPAYDGQDYIANCILSKVKQ